MKKEPYTPTWKDYAFKGVILAVVVVAMYFALSGRENTSVKDHLYERNLVLKSIHFDQNAYRERNGRYAQTLEELKPDLGVSQKYFTIGLLPACSTPVSKVSERFTSCEETAMKCKAGRDFVDTPEFAKILKELGPCRDTSFTAIAVTGLTPSKDDKRIQVWTINETKNIQSVPVGN